MIFFDMEEMAPLSARFCRGSGFLLCGEDNVSVREGGFTIICSLGTSSLF